jgi:hypothetical protein
MAKRFPRVKDGDVFEPYLLNLVYDELDRWRDLTGTGLIGVDGADGDTPPTIVDYRDDSGTALAKSGGSGIPALSGSTPGSGTVTLYSFNGTTLSATTTTVTAYNMTSGAVAANAWLQLKLIAGYWFIDVEGC